MKIDASGTSDVPDGADNPLRANSLPEEEGKERPGDSTPTARVGTPAFPLALSFVAALTTGISTHFRLGYQFGFGDQGVLAIKGISMVDRTAFVNDWFNSTAGQPHWTFDLLTAFGEKIGALPVVYFIYVVAALLAFGAATAILATHWLTARSRWLASIVGPILVLGPISPMGSTTPVLPIAIPHVLGGCLAYLAVALLISRRPTAAAIVTIVAALVHVQHGANLAVIAIAYVLLMTDLPKRGRITLTAAAIMAGLHAVLATRIRGITGNGRDFIEICERRSPHHCNANVWSSHKLMSGWFLALTIVALIWVVRKTDLRAMLAVAALPLVGLLAGVWADRMDLPVLGELAQSTNIYRLVTIILPLAAWAPILVMSRSDDNGDRGIATLLSAFLLVTWFSSYTAISDSAQWGAMAMALATCTLTITAAALWAPNIYPWVVRGMAGAVALACLMVVPGLTVRHVQVLPDKRDPRIAAGRLIESRTEPGSIIAAAPAVGWLRYASRRAVILDCKAVPYGGQPWVEFKERIEALGGWDCGTAAGFAKLTLEDVQDLGDRFGATHMLVPESDPKFVDAGQAGWPLIASMSTWLTDVAFPVGPAPAPQGMRLYEIG